ncbi:MAG: hypothetical protein AAGA54_27460 [Myxococcota bacterium]
MLGRRTSWLALFAVACSAPQPRLATPPASTDAICRAAAPVHAPARLPISIYSAPVDRFAELAASGVTTVGPYYGEPPDLTLLDAAHEAGLGVLYPVGFEDADLGANRGKDLKAQVDAVVDHQAVVGWYALPEEVRPWVASDLAYLAELRRAVHEADPRRRPLLSYQPNHRRRDELATASASFDVVTRGLYANFVGLGTQRAWVREGTRTIAAAATETQQAWAVLEMFEEPADADPARIDAWVRHDVYASLLGGARGVMVFSGWARPGFPSYATYLAAYLRVFAELNGPQALATPFLVGKPDGHASVRVLAGPASVPLGSRRVASVQSRRFLLEQTVWTYVVNSAEVDVTVKLDSPCPATSVVGPPLREGTLRMPPLGVAVLRAPAL